MDIGERRTVLIGTTIFSQGTPSDGAYVLLRGRCEALRDGEVLGTIEAGQVFGEMGAFGADERSATVAATTDCEVVLLTPEQMRHGLTSSPDLFLEVFLTVLPPAPSRGA
jgi:CRP-like cAMP-binding protein